MCATDWALKPSDPALAVRATESAARLSLNAPALWMGERAFASVLRDKKVDVLVSYLPVGSEQADKAYAQAAMDACASVYGELDMAAAKRTMIDWLTAKGWGTETVTYKLRDWLFSRQRYWGEPFPIVYDEAGHPIALPESMLPVELPDVDDYSPQALDPDDSTSEPVPPLARATDWATVTLNLGDGEKTYHRELNVMPQWAGSCWYEIRYLDPANDDRFVDVEVERNDKILHFSPVVGSEGERKGKIWVGPVSRVMGMGETTLVCLKLPPLMIYENVRALAMAITFREKPDVVVCDVHLPDGTATDVIQGAVVRGVTTV